MNVWKAPPEIVNLVTELQNKDHLPRLAGASMACCLDDSKPFLNNKLNLGKVSKFSPAAKLWQGQPHDFCLNICSELWESVLTLSQRPAYLDLLLCRCVVEYVPEMADETKNGKRVRKPLKDRWGRIQYTTEIKLDNDGNPKWKVVPADLEVLAENIRRYGLWCEPLLELKDAIGVAPIGGVSETLG